MRMFLALAALSVALSSVAVAQDQRGPKPSESETKSTRAVKSLSQSTKLSPQLVSELSAKEDRDRIRVIIEFEVPDSMTAAMAPDAPASQKRSAITAGREALMRSPGMSALSASKRASNIRRTYKFSPHIAFEGTASEIAAIIESQSVKKVSADIPMPPTLLQSTSHIGMPAVWSTGAEGSGQAVAILDTGVQTSHPFFGGRVVGEACFSTNASSLGYSSLCPNGSETQIGSGAGINCSGVPGCEHGTHVAGIAAGNEGSSSDGVARAASIISVQVFSRQDIIINVDNGTFLVTRLGALPSDIMAGLDYIFSLATTMDVAAVNLSLGGGEFFAPCPNDPLTASIDNLTAAGVAVVAASGNASFTDALATPACVPSAISVGATLDTNDNIWSPSNSANFLDLLAPGADITSSVPTNDFAAFSGTSMAAPHVAGAFSVLKSVYPDKSVQELLDVLRNSGVPVQDPRNAITTPRIAVDAALNTLSASPQIAITVFPVSGTYQVLNYPIQ